MWGFLIVMFVVCSVINCYVSLADNALKTFVQQQNMASFITNNHLQTIDQGPEKYADTSAIRSRFMGLLRKTD